MDDNSRLLFEIIGGIAGAGLAAGVTYGLLKPRLAAALSEIQLSKTHAEQLEQAGEQAKLQIELKAKESLLERQAILEQEYRERRSALDKQEARLNAKDEQIDQRRDQLDIREREVTAQQKSLFERESELQRKTDQIDRELQRIAGLDREQAREIFLKKVEADFTEVGLRRAKEIEQQTVADAERKARQIILDVMERTAVESVTEATTAVVILPSEDMKGRIIGREGRNIRTFEQVTGTDLIIDETPEAAVISCFDPIRRETARLTLMNLMLDGRIHPGRIEEVHELSQIEVQRMIAEAGERAAERSQIAGLHPKVIETMGRLRFRTSYAQNVLDHSVETSHMAGKLAAELGLNVEVAKHAGFLHDIGKALGEEWEGPHAITGMEYLKSLGFPDPVTHAVGAHHHDIEPASAEAILVILADSLSAARPGARRENLEAYVKRLGLLEAIANDFPGVERSFALQAGREIRLIVRPGEINDLAAQRLAHDVARKIESEMEYPGQIKVTVIRETRSSDTAR